jgi:hypothetical protein
MGFRSAITRILAAAALIGVPVGALYAQADEREAIWLDAHNSERAEFGSPPLVWNPALARAAQVWAEELARDGRLEHSPREARSRQGENLWMGTRGYFGARRMIEAFAAEKRHFKAGVFPAVSTTGDWSDVGHFTQIVWRDTREVGCASANGERVEVLVCRYFPAGNVRGTMIAPGPSPER